MKHLICILTVVLSVACTQRPDTATETGCLPDIYPDYTGITVPQNIAPLNFLLRNGDVSRTYVVATCRTTDGRDATIEAAGKGAAATFDMDEWKAFMKQAAGKTVSVKVYYRNSNGTWFANKTFEWYVTAESIDPYLTYRLIEPDYEVYNELALYERCIENFDERPICTYQLTGNRCMNCHAYGGQNPNLSMMYIRGEGGGAMLNCNGKLRKLDIKAPGMASGSVYYGFSPSGRYLVFSTNVIIPAFHSQPDKRLEVFDAKSDVYVADLHTNTIIRSPVLSSGKCFETFPTFSPDGKYIYFCTADSVALPHDIKKLQYSMVRVGFDEKSGTVGTRTDTLLDARRPYASDSLRSVCHPRISPDGRYLLYTVQRYGTFPIWHPEADQQMMDLRTGRIDRLQAVNSHKSDTYHAWSSNARWFVFASKRDDGLYGKPYFCYVDRHGRAHKPFVLPQRSPQFYDNCLKSFNAPELGKGRLPFNAHDVAEMMKAPAETFK